jgi:hypothetical protein
MTSRSHGIVVGIKVGFTVGSIVGFTVGMSLFAAPLARASDHTNLEENLPTTLTDARPIPYLGREMQGALRYEHDSIGREQFRLEPRFEAGFPRNGQIALRAPGVWNLGDGTDLGRAAGDFLYNLNQETRVLPSLSLGVGVEAPTGRGQRGFDPEARVYLTKSLPSSFFHQLHLNGLWQWNVASREGERPGRYRVALGYSFRVSPSVLGIVDVVRDQRMARGAHENLVELGARYQLSPRAVLAFGAGIGAFEQSPRSRFTLGFQYFAF